MDIEKRARELSCAPTHLGSPYGVWHSGHWMSEEHAIQLAREAADARAEEIARRCEGNHFIGFDPGGFSMHGCSCCAAIARSFISKPKEPETREAVLERALHQIIARAEELMRGVGRVECMPDAPHNIARRALAWKP